MTANKKAAKKTAQKAKQPEAPAALKKGDIATLFADTVATNKLAPVEVRYTEAQLFGTAPSAVFLDETAGVEVGGKPSETALTTQQTIVLDAAAELMQAELPKAPRSLADWIAEEATQGRFYGSLGAAQVGYGLMLARLPGGAQ